MSKPLYELVFGRSPQGAGTRNSKAVKLVFSQKSRFSHKNSAICTAILVCAGLSTNRAMTCFLALLFFLGSVYTAKRLRDER